MFKTVFLLTKLQVCNLFGLNEARFAKDPKKRKSVTLTLVGFLLIGVVLVAYSGGLSAGLASLGFVDVVPLYLSLMATVIIFGLTVFRAGVVFDIRSYEKLAALPVSEGAVVASRFLSLYVTNFLFSFAIVASGAIACGLTVGTDVWFVFSMICSSVFLPLIPMTLALLLGTLVYALFSRFKKKKFGQTLLALVLLAVLIVLPTLMDSDVSDAELITDIAGAIERAGNAFPPLVWLAKGTNFRGIGYYFLFIVLSVVVFAAYAFLVGKFYKNICSAISSKVTRGNFSLEPQKRSGALAALYKRELKRYFSSSTYFLNTFMGNFLALIASGACLFVGVDSLFGNVGLPEELLWRILPFLIALIMNISPMTACAISMEGKGWELTKSLPVEGKTVMNAKLLTQFTFTLPVALLSELFLFIAFAPTGLSVLWLIVVPIVYSGLCGVLGLFVNIKNPSLSWDNEAMAVKQGVSVLIMMLVGMGVGILSLVAIALVPLNFSDLVIFVIILAFLFVTWYYYHKITRVRLNEIDCK